MTRPLPLAAATALLATLALAQPAPAPAPRLHPDAGGEKWARETLGKLSLDEKVGQLFMIWVRARFMNEADPQYLDLVDAIRGYHVGSFALSVPVEGPVLVKSSPGQAALLLNRLQQESKWPLLVAADFEAGVAVRLQGATAFPQAMAFGATGRAEYAREMGRIVAQEARAVGVHWNFFPVADVNSNPANPIINTRSYGEDPQEVADMVAAYVAGSHEGRLLATAKHFPGHGDTDTDSHFGVARVGGDLARLERIELVPFRRAIAAGVDAVMVAHVTVPALEPSPDKVATTSRAIVTDLLKKRLGFRGLVVTDALDMAALTRRYAPNVGRAAVDAFEAGNDMLVIPADLGASWEAMREAVETGEIPRARLDESVEKILALKAAMGLHLSREVDVARVPELVGDPASVALGQQISDEAVTLVRDGGILPLKATAPPTSGLPYLSIPETKNRLVVVVLTADERGEAGRVVDEEIRARAPDAHVIFVDQSHAAGMTDEVLRAAGEAEKVVVTAFLAPNPGRPGEAEGEAASAQLLQALLERVGDKTVVVAVGSPYVAQSFPTIRTYLCTLSNAPVSERSAVRALFGEIPLRGRLPVTIPGVAERGAGIQRDAAVPLFSSGPPGAPPAVRGAEAPPEQIPLWANGAPGFESRRNEPEEAKDYWVRNVHNPSITAYLPPKERATGAAVVICPGGGHRLLVFDAEGREPAEFLRRLGVAAFALKYRLAREEGSPYTLEKHVREDAYRAMRLVRSRAKEWNVDPHRVGMLGFSAGGEVVALVAYAPGDGDPNAPDPVDRLNGRPDFQMLVYPGPLFVPKTVPKDAPPAFLLAANDDECCSAPVVSLLEEYRAAGVPVEAHLYARGDHAFNMGRRSTLRSIRSWPQRLADWLADSGYLEPQHPDLVRPAAR
jgi:beta-N-acetylhexosaminidase